MYILRNSDCDNNKVMHLKDIFDHPQWVRYVALRVATVAPAAPARSASPLAHYSGSNASRSEPGSSCDILLPIKPPQDVASRGLPKQSWPPALFSLSGFVDKPSFCPPFKLASASVQRMPEWFSHCKLSSSPFTPNVLSNPESTTPIYKLFSRFCSRHTIINNPIFQPKIRVNARCSSTLK